MSRKDLKCKQNLEDAFEEIEKLSDNGRMSDSVFETLRELILEHLPWTYRVYAGNELRAEIEDLSEAHKVFLNACGSFDGTVLLVKGKLSKSELIANRIWLERT